MEQLLIRPTAPLKLKTGWTEWNMDETSFPLTVPF